MEKSELSKLLLSNSARITYEDNNNMTSSAWNNYVIVVVDGKFSNHIKCVKCDTLLKWKHRDGTSGLLNHSKSCAKNKSVTKSDRKLTEGESTVCSLITKDLEKSTSSEAEPPRKKAKVSLYYICNFVLQLQKLKLMFVLQLTWNCTLKL